MESKKRILLLFITVLLLWEVCVIDASSQETTNDEHELKLLKSLSSKDWNIRNRAILELGPKASTDKEVRAALINNLFSSNLPSHYLVSWRILRYLSWAESDIVPEILNCFPDKSSKPIQNLDELLYLLGRMGPKANGSISFLLKQLEQFKNEPEKVAKIQVVLANIGYKPNDMAKILEGVLKKRDDSACSAEYMIMKVGSRDWINDRLIEEFIQRLDNAGDESVNAAVILGNLEEKGRIACNKMRQLIKKYRDKDDPRSSIYGFSFARICEASERTKVLENALRDIDKDTNIELVSSLSALLPDKTINDISSILDKNDPETLYGAILILGFHGQIDEKISLKLLEVISLSQNEKIKMLAAWALASVAPTSHLMRLEEVRQKEKSSSVLDNIHATIKVLKLEESGSYGF